MFYGAIGGRVLGFDQGSNRDLFDFSGGLVPKSYELIEQGILVISVLLLKTDIDFVILTIFFINTCFGTKK